jgi:hypothetical protein
MNLAPPSVPSKRLLDPVERISEILFGLIMALSFTCSLGVAEAGKDDVRTMMIGAIGCNIAWGLIDAIIFLMASLTERGRGVAMLKAVRTAPNGEIARSVISGAMPPVVAQTMGPEDLDKIHQKLRGLPDAPSAPRLGSKDYLAALGVFLLVFLATFPVVVPFMVMPHAPSALRVSNLVAVAMLFVAGYLLGRYAQHKPVFMGMAMTLVGIGLVGVTIALGG